MRHLSNTGYTSARFFFYLCSTIGLHVSLHLQKEMKRDLLVTTYIELCTTQTKGIHQYCPLLILCRQCCKLDIGIIFKVLVRFKQGVHFQPRLWSKSKHGPFCNQMGKKMTERLGVMFYVRLCMEKTKQIIVVDVKKNVTANTGISSQQQSNDNL